MKKLTLFLLIILFLSSCNFGSESTPMPTTTNHTPENKDLTPSPVSFPTNTPFASPQATQEVWDTFKMLETISSLRIRTDPSIPKENPLSNVVRTVGYSSFHCFQFLKGENYVTKDGYVFARIQTPAAHFNQWVAISPVGGSPFMYPTDPKDC